jgi:aspartyl-tRNA(Asn)/glutamyl-tRNA(Gln) amidotransferase subunit B
VQLATRSKIFSGASTAFGAAANTQACAIDLGLPGVLPVLNEEVVAMAVKFGLSVNADITERTVFARKNYFYPDLPKGYQISQMEFPIVGKGRLDILLENGAQKTIGITRAHLEEDAGKSLHEDFHGMSGIDLNRAGTPLLEIVSEPEIGNAKEAVAYLKQIHSLVRYLGISDGDMSQGSLRCDANVSVRPCGDNTLGTRVEIKNINSFRFIEKAINFEIERQIDLLENGGQVTQETRLYDADRDETRTMRGKEEANDYRYFPCPDLLPVEITRAFLQQVRQALPELPEPKRARFMEKLGLSAYDASLLAAERETADYFEAVYDSCQDAKLAANWVNGALASQLNRQDIGIRNAPVSAPQLGRLINRIKDRTLSGKGAKTVFEALWDGAGQGDVDAIIREQGLKQVSDANALEALVDQVMADHPDQVTQYRAAEPVKQKKMIGFFVGQVMKASRGAANPGQVNRILQQKLQP